MPIEGDSLSMEDLGMDLSIIDGYPGEQQTYGLSSETNDWSGPDEDNNNRPPIADSRSPIADSRSPIADSRPPIADSRSPIADSRPPTADRRLPNREENQSDYTFERWMDDLFGAANLI